MPKMGCFKSVGAIYDPGEFRQGYSYREAYLFFFYFMFPYF